MNIDELLKRQSELQKEGNELLEKTGIINFLSEFGKVEIGGSLNSGLMTWPDIDIGVISKKLVDENYWKIVNHLFYLNNYYHSLYIQDFRESVNPDSPKGLYVGLKIKFNNKMWKVDVWYVKPNKIKGSGFNIWLKRNLNENNKKIILEIKNQVHNNPKYRKEIYSVDIYKAVIEENVNDLNGFIKYLEKSGRSLD